MIEKIRQKVNELIDMSELNVELRGKYPKLCGVYMLYVVNFDDERIVPFYIGQSKSIHTRFKTHMKELLNLNRLTKSEYEEYLLDDFYNGGYKACKMFKYLIDHNCTLNDVKLVVLTTCAEEKLLENETYFINETLSEFFGFNQLNSVTEYNRMRKVNSKTQFNCELEYRKILKYLNYGFTRFNFVFAHDLLSDSDIQQDNLKKKIIRKFDDVEFYHVNRYVGEFDHEKYREQENQRMKFKVSAITKYLKPNRDYLDFPLKHLDLLDPDLKPKNNECLIYLFISNNNATYENHWYQSEVLKVKISFNNNGRVEEESYLIGNESVNKYYFEKKHRALYSFRRRTPFQVTNDYDEIKMISYDTEVKTGLNDMCFREDDYSLLRDIINNRIITFNENVVIKFKSNQSKRVLNYAVNSLGLFLRMKIDREIPYDYNLEGMKCLFMNNPLIKENPYLKVISKQENFEIRNVNDFERGNSKIAKGNVDLAVFVITKKTDKSIKYIKELTITNKDIPLLVLFKSRINYEKLGFSIRPPFYLMNNSFDQDEFIRILVDIREKEVERVKVEKRVENEEY